MQESSSGVSPIDAARPGTYNRSVLSLLHAGWLLAWSLVRTLFRRLVLPSDGLARFEQNYADDRLVPLTVAERELLPALAPCMACGRCDANLGARIADSHGEFRGMMAFVLSASRSMPDFDAASHAIVGFSDADLEALRTRCPADIPFSDLAGFVRRKAQLMPCR